MGLFGNKCGVCGKSKDVIHKAKDGFVCSTCYQAIGLGEEEKYPNVPLQAFRDQLANPNAMSFWDRAINITSNSITSPRQMHITPIDTQPVADEGTVRIICARCGSEQITANQKGFGVGKAVIGAAIAGPLGLAAGNMGAKKVRVTCLKCGHQWEAGKA